MAVYSWNQVNPLRCPVRDGDLVRSESGESYVVRQGFHGYWLQHTDGFDLTRPCGNDQIAICRQIADLANI